MKKSQDESEKLPKVEMEVHKRNIMLSKLFYIPSFSSIYYLTEEKRPRIGEIEKSRESGRNEIRPRKIVSVVRIFGVEQKRLL